MASSSIHGLFDIHSASTIETPLDTIIYKGSGPLGKQHHSAPSNIELKTPSSRTFQDDLIDAPSYQNNVAQTPKTPNDLESSQPPTPARHDAAVLVQKWNEPSMNKWRILCCCLIYFGNGLNDAVVGALIPYMESYYHISYSIMSMVFVGNAAGFVVAAFFTNALLEKLGRAKTLILSEIVMLSAYVALVCTPPYAVVVISFFFLGYGAAINIALNNVFCANLHPPSAILGAAHGSYGIGGTVAPIIGTAIVSHGVIWSRFYFLALGLRICCIAFSAWAFWTYEEDSSHTLLSALERTASRQATTTPSKSRFTEIKQALGSRVTILGALFIFAYQGAEVSISGWIISYLIHYRDGDPAKVGYVTAGFWGGITLGRFILTHAAPKIGEKTYVAILTLGTFALQLFAWFIPNVIGNAVAVSLLGLLMGPIYPCAQTIFSRLMPRHVQTMAIGFIGGAGSSGGAVAPFTTGILAQAAGTWVLHPVCIGLYGVMLACWLTLPRVSKRTD